MNEADDKMKQEEAKTKEKLGQEASKQQNKDDNGAQRSPERPIGSQKKATTNSRTPSNEMG